MKRNSFLEIIFVMIFALALLACSIQKDVNIKSIVIDEKSIPEFIVAGKFDEAGIKAIVTYEDVEVFIPNEFIASEDNFILE